MNKTLTLFISLCLIATFPILDLYGAEELVNTIIPYSQQYPSVAMDCEGNFVVSFHGYGYEDSTGIHARMYDTGGTPLDSQFPVNYYESGTQQYSAAAMDNSGNFIIVWETYVSGYYDIKAQLYFADGTKNGGEFLVNTSYTYGNQRRPSVAMNGSGDFVVAWDGRGSGYSSEVWVRLFDSSGTGGSQFRANNVTGNTQYYSAVGIDDSGDIVVAWASNANDDGDSSYYGVFARMFNNNGTPKGGQFQVNVAEDNNQRNPSVAMDSPGNFIIAWESYGYDDDDYSGYGIYAQRYHSNGTKNGGNFQVNTVETYNQINPAVAMSSTCGDFIIAWQTKEHNNYDIKAQKYFNDGSKDGSEFQVNSYSTVDQTNPAVAMSCCGDYAIAWDGIYDSNNSSYYSNSGDKGGDDNTCNDYYDVFCMNYQSEDNDAITLEWLTADAIEDDVAITWQTGSEIDNLGFFIVRSDNTGYIIVNQEIIPAMGNLYSGFTYQYIDSDVEPAHVYSYWLVDMNIYGSYTIHGPATAFTNLTRFAVVK